MGIFKDVTDSKKFCDEVFSELSGMKKKIIMMRERAQAYGEKHEEIGAYERHLGELVDEIDWKLQILSHSCANDWRGSVEFENDVQVSEADKLRDTEFSPGYLGG